MNRREFGMSLAALVVAGCAGGSGRSPSVASDGLQPVSNPAYDRWVAGFRSRATSQGFSRDLLDDAFRSVDIGAAPKNIKTN